MPSFLPKSSHLDFIYAVFLGLGASSCCIVQLVLNALNFGCAGFAYLDIYRPVFLTLSFIFATVTFFRNRNFQSKVSVLLMMALAISPMMVRKVNETGGLENTSSSRYNLRIPDVFSTERTAPTSPTFPTLRFLITGLSCESCASRVRASVREIPGVIAVKVHFHKKRLIVGYDPDGVGSVGVMESKVKEVVRSLSEKYEVSLVEEEGGWED